MRPGPCPGWAGLRLEPALQILYHGHLLLLQTHILGQNGLCHINKMASELIRCEPKLVLPIDASIQGLSQHESFVLVDALVDKRRHISR